MITSLTNPVTTTISCLAHCLLQILLEKVNNSPVLVMKILKKTSNLNINVSAARGGLSILILVTSPSGNMRFESAHIKLSYDMTKLLDPSGAMKSDTWYQFVG